LGIFVNVKIVNLLNYFLGYFSFKVEKKFKKSLKNFGEKLEK